jgi:DNA polymerase-3 subunit delta
MAARDSFTVESLRRELRKHAPEPIYVVEGEEALLAAQAVQVLTDAAVPPAMRDFNLGTFSGDDETGRQFLALARSYPFMGERRMVLVRRFDKLALRDRDETAFLEYLADPASTTVLVLVATKLDRRTTVVKTLEKHARIVQVNPLKDAELPGWVKERFAASGTKVTEAAGARLVELAGPALLDLGNEIDKIVARYPKLPQIDAPQVEATVGRHRAEEVWAINRAFRADNASGFLQALVRVMETEDEPIRLGAVLLRHVNDLLRVRLLLDRGVTSSSAVGTRLKKPPWIVEQTITQARGFTRRQLGLWFRNMQTAEVQMKSRRLPQRFILERALLLSFLGRELA